MFPEQTIELIAHDAGKKIHNLYSDINRPVKKKIMPHQLASWLSIEMSKIIDYMPDDNCIAHVLAISASYPSSIGSVRIDFNENGMISTVAAPPTIAIVDGNIELTVVEKTISDKAVQVFSMSLYQVVTDGIELVETWTTLLNEKKIVTMPTGKYIAVQKTASGFGIPSAIVEIT